MHCKSTRVQLKVISTEPVKWSHTYSYIYIFFLLYFITKTRADVFFFFFVFVFLFIPPYVAGASNEYSHTCNMEKGVWSSWEQALSF